MGEKTEIAWCDSTFNGWVGCTKISPGCDNCYAEALMDHRFGRVQWGPHGERKRTSTANWRQPVIWNKHAAVFQAQHGHRQRVFCSSLADVFDNQVPREWRDDLFQLIADTPELDWLLLTKRPENIRKLAPPAYRLEPYWPRNIWLGVTAENQEMYDHRWPILQSMPAAVRFISYEPAIGALELPANDGNHPDWIICGGESGRGYRGMPEEWALALLAECQAARVPFFMKQMAGKKPFPPGFPVVRQFPEVRHG